ncbi:hypothetical protein SOASR014_46700 [Pectobacterium carotovorum subsp. carotovorum]|nr:hypothetical protein SOASR014_46700 [Pectobacterium carotovorum subsp. carotovorum]GLX47008.1 hypothetical protein Pcaca01_46760 [Pectobacterium carotovorum subsp. carotovorum]
MPNEWLGGGKKQPIKESNLPSNVRCSLTADLIQTLVYFVPEADVADITTYSAKISKITWLGYTECLHYLDERKAMMQEWTDKLEKWSSNQK